MLRTIIAVLPLAFAAVALIAQPTTAGAEGNLEQMTRLAFLPDALMTSCGQRSVANAGRCRVVTVEIHMVMVDDSSPARPA